jgi:hypothetical protein
MERPERRPGCSSASINIITMATTFSVLGAYALKIKCESLGQPYIGSAGLPFPAELRPNIVGNLYSPLMGEQDNASPAVCQSWAAPNGEKYNVCFFLYF